MNCSKYKEVRYDLYCPTCKYKNMNENLYSAKQYDEDSTDAEKKEVFDEDKIPCYECLMTPVNWHSKKPINYKEEIR